MNPIHLPAIGTRIWSPQSSKGKPGNPRSPAVTREIIARKKREHQNKQLHGSICDPNTDKVNTCYWTENTVEAPIWWRVGVAKQCSQSSNECLYCQCWGYKCVQEVAYFSALFSSGNCFSCYCSDSGSPGFPILVRGDQVWDRFLVGERASLET